MTSITRLHVRKATLALAMVASAGLAAVAAPASAVSGTLSYVCTSSPDIGAHVFTAVIDTDAPATFGSGLSAPIKTTSTVTVPAAVADDCARSTPATSRAPLTPAARSTA